MRLPPNAVTSFLLPIAVLASACSAKPSDEQAGASVSASATSGVVLGAVAPGAAAAASAMAVPAIGVARSEAESNDLYEFEYAYPAAAGGIAALKASLDTELEKTRSSLRADAKEQKAEAAKENFPFRALSHYVAWKVVTDLPGWLSLSAEVSTYEGGAHPNHGFEAMVWDRSANQRRDPKDLFVSNAALSRAIRPAFCREIDRQRARKRGEPVKAGGDELFTDCIDPLASTVILGSSNRRTFDRVGILVGPYEAGPYAEGDYEVTLPVTAAVLAAVKPEYRASFATGR
jgi:hypothetical protein